MYLRLKFTATSNHFDSVVNSKPVSQHIKEALDGTTAISVLPASVFDINNCVRLGSLPTTVAVSFANSTSTDSNTRNAGCYIQFQKHTVKLPTLQIYLEFIKIVGIIWAGNLDCCLATAPIKYQ